MKVAYAFHIHDIFRKDNYIFFGLYMSENFSECGPELRMCACGMYFYVQLNPMQEKQTIKRTDYQ
jgi:hypothetical protein